MSNMIAAGDLNGLKRTQYSLGILFLFQLRSKIIVVMCATLERQLVILILLTSAF